MATFTRNSILTRIQDFVGDDVSSIIGYKDIINTGFNFVADLIPAESELWREAQITTMASFLIDVPFSLSAKTRVLLVTRTDSDGIKRVCKEVSFDMLQRGKDSTSIYFNGGNYKNPVYSYDASGTIVIQPTIGDDSEGGHVSFFQYLTDTDLTDSGEVDGTNFRFPNEALYLGILRASSNLLQAKVSQAVHEDEDAELLSLVQAQMALVDKAFQEEIQRLGLPHQLIGDGNESK